MFFDIFTIERQNAEEDFLHIELLIIDVRLDVDLLFVFELERVDVILRGHPATVILTSCPRALHVAFCLVEFCLLLLLPLEHLNMALQDGMSRSYDTEL